MAKMRILDVRTSIPESLAATGFSPTEITLLPKDVYFKKKAPTAKKTIRMITGTGITSAYTLYQRS
jgi:hypothetical protein